MDKKELFANDGSFMERFKQMQKEMEDNKFKSQNSAQNSTTSQNPVPNKRPFESKPNDNISKKNSQVSSSASGKLAFSLKSKSKIVAPAVKLGIDEEEEEEITGGSSLDSAKRHKLDPNLGTSVALGTGEVVRSPPGDYTVRKVIDRLAILVAKNGRQHEHITRQRNPGDTPFKFLFDKNCSEYKYYEYKLFEEEKAIARSKESNASGSAHHGIHTGSGSKYQTPASALYEDNVTSGGSSSGPASSDPVAMMEYYMKKAAQEEKKKPPKLCKSEMPPPPSLLNASGSSGKRGHHMGDFIPQEELEKFMAQCNDAAALKAAKEAAEKAKIQADNIGHKLLSKMGWREGEGLGSEKSGRSDPVMAGGVKKDNLGVGAVQPGEVNPEDDIYEQYKKRMMLGYRHRPNPLGNPRKSYY